ncbi:MAG: S8 family serine peptidase [Saprospiraceae bacterium]
MHNTYFWALLLCLGGLPLFAQQQTQDWKTESRQSKISVDLLQLQQAYLLYQNQRGNTDVFQLPHEALTYKQGAVQVEIITNGPATALVTTARNLGMTDIVTFQRVLNGSISLTDLERLSRLPDIISINPVYAHTVNSGVAQTQGDQAQRTDLVRRAFGIDGTGIKIGVLSDSYNYKGGAAAAVSSGELPGIGNPYGHNTPVDVLADNGSTDEGRAMLEIIHDIAPGAELAFHTAKGGSAAFAQGIIDLARVAHCDIIVDDIIYRSNPFFQDGLVAQAVDSVHHMGVTYFTSAGNQADNSYESSFQEGETSHLEFTDALGRAYSADLIPHDFAPGDHLQAIRIPNGATLTLALQWSDRYTSISGLPGPESDIDFFLLSADGKEVIAASANNNAYSDPLEMLSYTNNTGAELKANLMIGLVSGPVPALIKYISYGSLWADEYLEGAATCIGQANAEGAITVGAAGYYNTPEFGVADPTLQSFSSMGGTPIFANAGNSGTISGIVRNKPDIVAPDGGDNSFFGSDSDGNGLPNFFGTSAAAPHAAGIAALLLDLDESLQPEDIRRALESTSTDMVSEGFDYRSGWGLVDGFSAALREARYTPEVYLQESDQLIPGNEFTGNGLVTTDMRVSTGFQVVSGSSIRLTPGFRTDAGATFSAKIDQNVIIDRPESGAPAYRPVEMFTTPAPQAFAVATPQTVSIGLEAYPNPFRQFTTISVQTEREQEVTLQIVNASGRLIIELQPLSMLPAGERTYTFDGQELPSGLYYVVMKMDGQSMSKALVKQ